MNPWYRGFRGTIQKITNRFFLCSGEVSVVDESHVEISELPVGVWTEVYKETVSGHRFCFEKNRFKKKKYIKDVNFRIVFSSSYEFAFLFQIHIVTFRLCPRNIHDRSRLLMLQVLEPLLQGSPQEPSLIDDYREYHTDTVVRFQIKFKNGKLPLARQRGLHQVTT